MTWHQKAHEALNSLGQQLRIYDGMFPDLRDNQLHVIRWTGGGKRTETITCVPRPTDFDRLWFYASDRSPLGEAERVPDVALEVARRMGPGQ